MTSTFVMDFSVDGVQSDPPDGTPRIMSQNETACRTLGCERHFESLQEGYV